ncbi:MAG: hypothetical protein DRO11_10605, partial [Methanobacteriota archaeon]
DSYPRGFNPQNRQDYAKLVIKLLNQSLSSTIEGKFALNLPLFFRLLGVEENLGALSLQGELTTEEFLEITQSSVPDIGGKIESTLQGFTAHPLLLLLNDPSFILDGMDVVLGGLEDVFASNIAQDLPLIGSKLINIATFLRDIRLGLLTRLRKSLSGKGNAIEILKDILYKNLKDVLQDNNKDNKIDISDIVIQLYDANLSLISGWSIGDPLPEDADAVQFYLPLGGTVFNTGIPLPIKFDIPGLGLKVDGGFEVKLDWSYDFGFGISLSDGFYLLTNPDSTDPELKMDISIYLDNEPTNPGVRRQFTAQGKFLFFKVTVKDTDSDPHTPGFQPGGVYGSLSVDIKGDRRLTFNSLLSSSLEDIFHVDFGVKAMLNWLIVLQVGEKLGLPKLKANFILTEVWNIKEGITSSYCDLVDLRVDVGSLVRDFLYPIAKRVQDTLEPIRPVVEILTYRIPGLDFIMPSNPNLMGLINLLRQLNGQPPIDWSFVYAAKYMLDVVDVVNSMMNARGEILLGELHFPARQEFTPDNIQISPVSDPLKALDANLKGKIDQLKKNSMGSNYSSGGFSSQKRQGFEFLPYITDIHNWVQILTGGDAILFTYEMPILKAEFNFRKKITTIMIGPVPLDIFADGGIRATVDLAFGYDTFGIKKALRSGNGWDVLDGFFIIDYKLVNHRLVG